MLDRLIATPSVSRDEAATADIIEALLKAHVKGEVKRIYNNVYVRTPMWDDARPTLLMKSYHDTMKSSASYTRNPYEPTNEEGRIYGTVNKGMLPKIEGAFRAIDGGVHCVVIKHADNLDNNLETRIVE